MTWIDALSFRTHLTLRWTVTFAVLLALVNLVIYLGASAYSRRDLDAQVQMLAANDMLSAAEVTEQGYLFEQPASAFRDFGAMPAYGQLLTLDGQVANATPSLKDLGPLLDSQQVRHATEGGLPLVTTEVRGRPLRLLAVPVNRDARPFILVMGVSEAPLQQRQRPLAALLVGVWVGAVLLTALAGFVLASRALRPIDRITSRATAIARGDFKARLDPPGVDDEIGRMTRMLNDVFDRLHGAIETNRHFAADASHELRTPLTALQGEVDVALKRERSVAEYQETLEVVRDGLRYMIETTENLMVLVRAQERVAERIVEEVALGPLLESSMARARAITTPRGLTLRADTFAGVVIYGDARLYARVFDNLLANAVHYNREDGAVTVTARYLEAASDEWAPDRVLVSVTDTGTGIPPEEWQRVFERFRRIESGRQRRRGAGLGLAICREVVALYGGTIRVAASSESGTTIEVDLPGRLAAARPPGEPGRSAATPA
jgi:signal transduction histidine kinase